MHKDYRNGLMFESLKQSKPAQQLKFGGTIKSKSEIKVPKSKGNYGGSVNIANALKAEADLIYKEMVNFQQEVNAEMSLRASKGYKSTIRKWQEQKLADYQRQISNLRATAKDIKGEGNNVPHDFQKPQPRYAGRK